MTIEELLKIVQRTNPDMTKEKLIREMAACNYSANTLIMLSTTTPKELD